MQCPNDNTTLIMADRAGIEIDYCPQCRGVWLDRGELDKLIERSASAYTAASASSPATAPATSSPIPSQEYFKDQESKARFQGPNYHDSDHSYQGDKHYDKQHGSYHKRHKKESFLSDLFDF